MNVVSVLTIINRVDEYLASEGHLLASQIRSVSVETFSVDTNCLRLYLPADLIARLGLRLSEAVRHDVSAKTRLFQDANLSLFDREGTFECVEIPSGQSAVVGRIPLDMLGLKPDLENDTLRVLPDRSADTYWTA